MTATVATRELKATTSSVRRIGILVLYGAVLLAMAIHFAIYIRYAIAAVRFPFELDYGEGIVWQQAMLIPGARMYGDITHFPFIVFHYPPLYHLAVHAASAAGVDGLLAGRSISLLSTLAIGAMAGALAFEASIKRSSRLAGAAVAGLAVFCFWPVVAWSPMLRVDMLAIALSFLGVWCAIRAGTRPRLLYVAVLLFALAVWTKQSCIAAPLATLPVMLVTNRRSTLLACGLGLSLSVVALLIMVWATDGGFLRHILLYNLNRFNLANAVQALLQERRQVIFLCLALLAIVVGWRRLAIARGWTRVADIRRDIAASSTVRATAMLTLYFVATTATLATLGKSGASLNYMIEWMCVWSVLIGTLFASTMALALTGPKPGRPSLALLSQIFALLLPMALVAQVAALPAACDFGQPDRAGLRQLEELETRVRNADRPVLSDDMVLLMKAGKDVPWEPAIFAELASTGRWDERRITEMVEARAFAFVITRGQHGERTYDSRYTPAVDRAIATAYPRIETYAGRTLHMPLQ